MEGECKVQLDASVPTEDRKHTTTQSFRPSSKLTTALLAFTLCLAVAASALLFFKSNTKGLQQDEDDYGDLRHTLRQISDGKAAIHLEGRRGETSVQWKVDENHSHSQGGLELVGNEIVIPRRGLYFVYSQASFSVNCSGGDEDYEEDSMVHLSHTVKRWSRSFGKYEIILNSVRTACQRMVSTDEIEDGNWYTAIYMGAVFDLHKGDKLKAGMEKKMLQDLQEEAGKTFFGVFAL